MLCDGISVGGFKGLLIIRNGILMVLNYTVEMLRDHVIFYVAPVGHFFKCKLMPDCTSCAEYF